MCKGVKITQDKLLREKTKRDYYLRLPGFLVEFVRRHVKEKELRERIQKTEQKIHDEARILIEKETKQDKAQLAEIKEQIKESRLDGKTCLHHSPVLLYTKLSFVYKIFSFMYIKLKTQGFELL